MTITEKGQASEKSRPMRSFWSIQQVVIRKISNFQFDFNPDFRGISSTKE
jgi:hypothetical protein